MASPYIWALVELLSVPTISSHSHRFPTSTFQTESVLQSTPFGRYTRPYHFLRSLYRNMWFSTSSSQQATVSSSKSASGFQKLRQITKKILQKIKLPKIRDYEDFEEPETQEARFVTFTPPTEAPQIIDLKALKRTLPPQVSPINVDRSNVSRSGAVLVRPELRLQTSFKASLSSTEMSTPLLKDAQPVPISAATSDHSATASLDDIADYKCYQLDDEQDNDMDWALLDLPENVLNRLVNESCYSLL